MNTYTVFWRDGKSELMEGANITDAIRNSGYGNGALRAIDFYTEGDKRNEYAWDTGTRSWKKI